MPKVRISDSQGLVQEAGAGVVFEGGAITFNQGSEPVNTINAITATGAVTKGGVFTVSGTTAVTVTLPAAANVAGSKFIFRSLSQHAHLITGSSADAGSYNYFCDEVADASGQRIALEGNIGSSVALISDGKNFMVFANSGSLTINVP
jgi:hypothetical protein